METTNDASEHSEAVLSEEPETAEVFENFHAVNEELRRRFLECNREIQQARAAGDVAAEERARRKRAPIGNEFVEKNLRLAVSGASAFLIGSQENRKEHLQAALLGLWEAFVGTDEDLVDAVMVDEDGTVHAASGWDPDKGTFATFAGSFISGRTRRSVQTVERTGISYNTWSEEPKVALARRELTEALGRTPSLAEIAARAGVTIATVRACSTATPVSLQTPVSEDGATTLGDRLANISLDEGADIAGVAEDELVARARQMAVLDLLVLALRTGITGRAPLTVNRTADKLCVGRGSAQLAIKRALGALVPEKAIPEPASCPTCEVSYAYDASGEPELVLTEFDVPSGVEDMPMSEFQSLMAAWTERVNEAHQRELAEHDKALIAYRTKEREAAQRFVAEHRRHGVGAAPEAEDGTVDLASLLAPGR